MTGLAPDGKTPPSAVAVDRAALCFSSAFDGWQFFGKDGCAEFAGVNPERPAQLEYFHDLLDAGSLCERARNVAADAGV
jgi:hypothetical protein